MSNPFLAILRLKRRKRKKIPMATKLEGGEVKALVTGPRFFLRLPLDIVDVVVTIHYVPAV